MAAAPPKPGTAKRGSTSPSNLEAIEKLAITPGAGLEYALAAVQELKGETPSKNTGKGALSGGTLLPTLELGKWIINGVLLLVGAVLIIAGILTAVGKKPAMPAPV